MFEISVEFDVIIHNYNHIMALTDGHNDVPNNIESVQ